MFTWCRSVLCAVMTWLWSRWWLCCTLLFVQLFASRYSLVPGPCTFVACSMKFVQKAWPILSHDACHSVRHDHSSKNQWCHRLATALFSIEKGPQRSQWWFVYIITWIRVQFGNNCMSNGQSNCKSDSECNLCLLWVHYENPCDCNINHILLVF